MELRKKRIALGNPDLDGISSYILAGYFEIEFDDILIVDYSFFDSPDHKNYVLGFEEIFFIDFAPDEAFYNEMIKRGIYFWIFDHHESDTSQFLFQLPKDDSKYKIYIDLAECGTSLFFKEYLRPQLKRIKPIVKQFVHRVWTYDCWQIDSPDWEEGLSLNRVCYGQQNWGETGILAYKLFIDKQTRKLQSVDEWFWTKEEQEIIERTRKREVEILEEARPKLQKREDERGKIFGVIDIAYKISLTAHALLKENPDLDYIIVVNRYGGFNGKLSFRSNGELFDCNNLFVAHGHSGAAGGTLSPDEVIDLLSGKIWCLTYNEDFEKDGKKYLKIPD